MAVGRWFRIHTEILTRAKIQKLPPRVFKHWINLLCVVAEADLGAGRVPSLEQTAYQMHQSESKVDHILNVLVSKQLLDRHEGWFKVHDWDDWQYHSDISTQRVRAFRARKQKPSETVSETVAVKQSASVSVSVSESSWKGESEGEGADGLYEQFCAQFLGEIPADLWQRFDRYVTGFADVLVENLPLWMKCQKYQNGFAPNADRWLKSGVWKLPPKPQQMGEKPAEEPW